LVTLGLANVANLSVTGNVDGGNLRTAGLISATGNITAAANISGSYILGNGSQLTGISAAVSVSKISNGTSEANIGASGGNANISIGGTSNVVVFTTSTAYFASDISISAIQKISTNAVGNIGSSSNYFNTVFAAAHNGTTVSAAGNVTGGNINTAGDITGGTSSILSVNSITHLGTNAIGNIGSSSSYFNQVFATATTALYADVAERFAADEILEPGTVVELGGTKEITRSQRDLSDNVFGVISTRAAYLMNGGAGDNDTHPPVAMTGRVPVKVIGIIRKGDRLVSAGNGIARAAQPGEATSFNVIGRSLVNKLTEESGTIEAIVTIKN
jgi:hypothetical protein